MVQARERCFTDIGFAFVEEVVKLMMNDVEIVPLHEIGRKFKQKFLNLHPPL